MRNWDENEAREADTRSAKAVKTGFLQVGA